MSECRLLSLSHPIEQPADDDGSVSPTLRYDVALLYLDQTDYDLDTAIENYKEDEQWEKDHPMEFAKGKAKDRSRKRTLGTANGLIGQLS